MSRVAARRSTMTVRAVAVTPELTLRDYANADTLATVLEHQLCESSALRHRFEAAAAAGERCERNADVEDLLLVFPETVGTWFVVADDVNTARSHRSWATSYARKTNSSVLAMLALIFSHFLLFLQSFWLSAQWSVIRRSGPLGVIKRAIFIFRSPVVSQHYEGCFARIARNFDAHVIAGSAFLPAYNKHLPTGLYNVTACFAPDGSLSHTIHKSLLVPEEGFIDSAGPPAPVDGIWRTRFANVVVLICADSWHAECYPATSEAQIICVPAFIAPASKFTDAWPGYSTRDGLTPADVDLSDVLRISERDAWRKYALEGRCLSVRGCRVAILSVLHGSMWELVGGGESMIRTLRSRHDGQAETHELRRSSLQGPDLLETVVQL